MRAAMVVRMSGRQRTAPYRGLFRLSLRNCLSGRAARGRNHPAGARKPTDDSFQFAFANKPGARSSETAD